MENYKLVLKENESLVTDVDDLMEQEIVKFHEAIKDVTIEEMKLFDNWVRIYKLLNYDIIDGLTVENVYRFNPMCAVVEIKFRDSIEFDFLILNPDDMTVSCMNSKEKSVRKYIVRRLLAPQTAEDALVFAKSELTEKGIQNLIVTINELNNNKDKFIFELKDEFVKLEVKEEKQEEGVEEKQEEVKEEVVEEKQEEVKEEVVEEKQEEVKEEINALIKYEESLEAKKDRYIRLTYELTSRIG